MPYSGRPAAFVVCAVVCIGACGGEIKGDGKSNCVGAECGVSPTCGDGLFCADAARQQPVLPFERCGEPTVGDRSQYPVDLIWVLDTSVSMWRKLSWVANNLNDMAGYLQEKRANVRVMLLGGPDVCVAPPLGGPGCQDGPAFHHVKEKAGNQETLRLAVDLYPTYKDFLRPTSRKVLVAVSDTNPNPDLRFEGWPEGVNAATFDQRLRALAPSFQDYVFHSIVAFPEDGGQHPNGCAGAERYGRTYLDLTAESSGLKFSVCNNRQGEWGEFLDELATQVAGLVNVPCEYPQRVEVRPGQLTNATEVLVEAEVERRWQTLAKVPDAETCGSELAWYAWEDTIHICPAACRSLAVTQIRIHRGCSADGPH